MALAVLWLLALAQDVREEVLLPSTSAGVDLAGEWRTPPGDGPFPAVILVPGGSPLDRDGTLWEKRPLLALAEALVAGGCAVWRMDDRGTGASGGSKLDTPLAALRGDVEIALDFVLEQERADAARVGIVGHSQGALLAAAVAARRAEVRFLVLLGATALPAGELIAHQLALDGDGTGELNARLARRMLEVVAEGGPAAELPELVRAAWELALAPHEREGAANATTALERVLPVWTAKRMLRDVFVHDPAPDLARVCCPVLALVGEMDQGRAAPNPNLAALVAAFERGGLARYTVEKLPRLNHFLQTCERGDPGEARALAEAVSPRVLRRVVRWVREDAGEMW